MSASTVEILSPPTGFLIQPGSASTESLRAMTLGSNESAPLVEAQAEQVEHLGVAATFNQVEGSLLDQPDVSDQRLGLMARIAEKARALRPTRAVLGTVAGLALLASGCGGGSDSASKKQDLSCFTEMTPEQKGQLVEYTHQSPEVVNANADGTQTVCVLEKGADGSYEAHNYKKDDKFDDYLLYSLMSGQSRSLATFGLLSGDLSLSQALTLSLLSDVGSNGSVYRPYSQSSDGWHRNNNGPQTVINNVRVTNVQYGSNPPAPYSSARKAPPPSGYAAPVKLPPAKVERADVQPGGKVVPSPAKQASGNTIKNPSNPNNSNKAPSGSSAPRTTSRPPATRAPVRVPTGKR